MAIRYAGNSKGIHNFLGKKTDFGSLGSQGIMEDANSFAAMAANNAKVQGASIAGAAKIAAAQHWADAGGKAADASAQSSMVSGITGGITSAIGGLSLGGGGGGGSFGNSGWGSFGDYSGGLSSYNPGVFG